MANAKLSGPMDPPSISIEDAVRTCEASIRACCSIEALVKSEWAQNRLLDFRMWTAGLGVFAAHRASLSRRLSTNPQALEVLITTVNALSDTFEECRLACTRLTDRSTRLSTPPPRSSLWSSGSDRGEARIGTLSEYQQDAEQLLGALIRLGTTIRKSGTTARLARADATFRVENHEQLRQHLSLILLRQRMARKLEDERMEFAAKNNDGVPPEMMDTIAEDEVMMLSKMMESVAKGEAMSGMQIDTSMDQLEVDDTQAHLILANLYRRNRFEYARRHAVRLAERPNLATTRPIPNLHGEKVRPIASQSQSTMFEQSSQQGTKEVQHSAQQVGPGSTVASAVEVEKLNSALLLQQVGRAKASTTIVSKIASKISYPQPPAAAKRKGAQTFTCPCCSQCISTIFAENTRWRKHITEDLRPYTCLFADCPSWTELYTTRRDWISHLRRQHHGQQYWSCIACSMSENFPSPKLLELHYRDRHDPEIPQEDFEMLLELCARFEDIWAGPCPICRMSRGEAVNEQPHEPTKMALQDDDYHEPFLDHIGDCLHAFSLLALPWTETPSENTEGAVKNQRHKCLFCSRMQDNTALFACGHVVACHNCSSRIAKCPVCSRGVKAVVPYNVGADTDVVQEWIFTTDSVALPHGTILSQPTNTSTGPEVPYLRVRPPYHSLWFDKDEYFDTDFGASTASSECDSLADTAGDHDQGDQRSRMTRRNAESGESAPQAGTVYKYATSGLSLPEYRLKRPQLKYPAGYNDQDPVIKTGELKLLSRAPNLDVLECGEKAVVCRFRIIDNNSGDDWLAVKIRPDKDDPDRNITLAEWRVLQSLDHNHIIATVGAYEKDQGRQGNQIGILLYPLAATSLEARIHSLSEDNQQAVPDEKREVNSKAMLEFLPCLCRAVIYLHQQGIEHHDIKAGNILFDRSDTVILADFDRATKSENDDLLVSQQSAIQDADTYAPDRVLDNHPLRKFKDDVSCLGIVFLEVATVILGETIENFNDCLRFEERSNTLEEDRIVRWIEHLKNTVSQRPHKRLSRVDLWPLQLDLIFRMIKAGPDDEDVLRVACAQFSSLCEPCKHCSPEAGWSASSM